MLANINRPDLRPQARTESMLLKLIYKTNLPIQKYITSRPPKILQFRNLIWGLVQTDGNNKRDVNKHKYLKSFPR